MSEHTPLTEAEREALGDWQAPGGRLEAVAARIKADAYAAGLAARIKADAYAAGLAARTSTTTADNDDDVARAIRTLLPGLRVANYVEHWSPSSPAVTALGILARHVGEEVDEAGALQDPHVPSAHPRRPEGEAATADTEATDDDLEALAERWQAVLDEVLADQPSTVITHPEVLALSTCLRELRTALAARRAARERIEAHEPRWWGTGYGGGRMVCACGDDCDDGYVVHLLTALADSATLEAQARMGDDRNRGY